MLLRSGRSWAVDLFLRRGWLVKRRKVRRRPSSWQPLSTIPAECLEQRILLSTITVTTLADNLTSDGQVTLREAIKAANTDTSVDGSTAGQAGVQNLIVFQPGLTGTISLNAGLGQMTITSSLEIQGLGAAGTIIDAQHNSRIFNITSAAGDVTLDSLTLENGKTTADNAAGGAVYSRTAGMLTIQNSTLTGNSTSGAGAYGGAIFAGCLTTVTNCILTGNSTTGTDAVGGAIKGDNPITVIDSTLSGNFTAGFHSYGGAIASYSSLTVTNSTLSGNSTTGNSTTGFAASGGAIRCNGPLDITNSTVVGNFTTGAGATGGGIGAVGTTVITNSTIVQNQAVNAADGGIYHDLVDGSTITLINTILAQNTDDGTAPDGNLVPVTAPVIIEYSLIGNNTGTALAAAPLEAPDGNGNFIGTSSAPINPVLGALGNNGGPTQTMALLADSPAINSGNNILAIDPATSDPPTTDQRGAPFQRIFNGTVDMGAYEYQTQPLSLVVNSAADTQDAVYDPSHLTLRDAVGLANGNAGPDTITFAPALNGTPIDLTLGQLTITDSVTIIGNGPVNTTIDAQQNSRVFNVGAGSEDVAFEDLTITGGKTTGSSDSGGGIQFLSSGQLLVENSALSGNTSTAAKGGGIYTNVGPVTILNSTISGNSVVADHKDGGGIFAQNGNVIVTNSTLTGNTAGGAYGDGGAIYATNGNVTVTNSTITRNATLGGNSEGGGIKTVRGSLTLLNTIVSGNTIQTSPFTSSDVKFTNYASTATFVAQHSLIGVSSGTPLNPAAVGAPDANGNLVGTFASPLDAKLGPLADNGGLTQTMALLLGSPAINAGSNTLAVAPDNSPLSTDQRGAGFPRINAGTVDMGSYEYQAPAIPLIVTTANDVLDTGGIDPHHLSLRDAVALANASGGPDQITFSSSLAGVPIDLTLGELLITGPVTITGLGAKSTIIDAQGNSRVFDVAAEAGDFTLNALTVAGGKTTVSYGDGAGIQFLSSGHLTITNSAISGNLTTGTMGQGAGIFTRTGAVLVVNSTISGNTTTGTHGDGVGIFSQHGTVSLFNSTVSGNYASGYHAGTVAIGTYYAEATITLTDSTVADNIDYGGNSISSAVGSARASIVITNSIIAGNICSKGMGPDVGIGNLSGTATFVAKNSLIGIDNGTPLNPTPPGVPDANGNLSGTFASPLNAKLGPLADNGGPTLTMALLAGSPALGAGAIFNDAGNNPITTDQRGEPRIAGAVDIGAYQSPTIASIGRSNPATSPATASSVTFVVTFNEPVLNVTAGDFTVNAGTVSVSPVSSSVYDVTVSSLSSFTGTLTLGISAGQTITDAGGGRLLNTTPTGTDVNTYFIDDAPPVFTSPANTTFTIGIPGTFTVTASSFLAAVLSESNTDVLPSGVKFNAATGVLSGTPAAGTAGIYLLHFTASDGLSAGVKQTVTLTVNQPLDLTGVWLVNSAAGVAQGLGHISSSGASLTIVNANGASTTGSLSGTNRITAASLDGNSNVLGTIDTTAADDGRITWSDGFVWLRVSLGGQWAVTSGGTTTLASITQNSNQVTLVNGATTTNATIGYNTSLGQAQLQLSNNTIVALANDSFTLNGQVWKKLDLPTNYTTSFGGGAVSVVQNGTTSLTFVNGQGQKSPGFWLSPTQVVATAFGNEVGTLANGAITWSTGEIWTENVVLNGTKNGASGSTSVTVAPSIAVLPDQYTIISYVNSANASLKQYLIQNGTNTALFINDAGQMAIGTFINSTQYNIAAWGVTATIAAGEITFTSGLSWTQTVLASTAPVVITSYVNVGDAGRRYLVQDGTSQVALLNTTVNLGTFTSPTTFTVPAVGLTATFSSGKISFTNGSSWMQTDLGNSLPVSVATYVSTSNASKSEFFIQNGTSNALFINDAGQMALGTYINPTQINIAAWSLTATIGAGQINFTNGTAWTLSFLSSSPITITSFANQSDSSGRYLVQNGTSQLAILNANMVLGTFTNATHFNVPAAGITGTISTGQISFSNGSSWLQTSPVASSVTANYYICLANGNEGEVFTNGNTVLFIKSDGSRAFATLVSGTTYNIAAWNLQATFSPGKVTFNNGSFWTQTNAPLPTVTFTDTNGASFKVQMLTRTTFIAFSGSLAAIAATRQDGKLAWANGTVWNNFDFNAVNALFLMATGYP